MAPTPDRWQRIEALYHSALERDPANRAAFLDGACGQDADLRREIESLLAEAATGTGLLAQPASALLGESVTIALMPGTRLGPYQIEQLIGQGGMGRVYRTRDTRLGRTVAIKTSSARFSERFEREARAVAALNHPHICHLYDVGPDYLVMEYIEGAPLVSKEKPGPFPIDQVQKYAEQILDALDAAHRAGIVHRDLKPGNILVSKQGIKLLDFGLARMESGPDDQALTQTGAMMGTPAYMAPEQWEGKQADARSDIYSFGCVLYEMLTGKRVGQDRAVVDPPFEAILRTCLEKDPEERWQSARELKHALRWAAAAKSSVAKSEGATAAPSQSRFVKAGWVVVGVLGVALAGLSFVHFREIPPPERILSASIAVPEGSSVQTFAVSPDGRYLVIAVGNGDRQLWLRPMNARTAQPIPLTEGATYPFWSPDSRFIAFFAMGKLKKVPVGGGLAQSVCDVPSSRGGSWSRDDIIVFSPANSGISIQRVSASGGTPVDVTRTKGNQRHPRFLPDGRRFLYLKRDEKVAENGVYVSSLDGSENRRVLPDVSGVEFAPPGRGDRIGHLLFVRDNTLMAVPFDAASAQVAGAVFPVADGVSLTSPSSYLPVTVSNNGVLVYAAAAAGGGNQIRWYDRTGKSLALVGASGAVANPALSADEKLVVYQRATSTGSDIWVHDLNRGVDTRLTNDPSSNVAPFWSPAGDRVVFASNRTGVYNLYLKAASGGGREVPLLPNRFTDAPSQWSRDGRFIVYFELDPREKRDLWLLPAEGGTADRKPIQFLLSESDGLFGQLSPDGHWMAFASNRSGRREVYVRPFPAAEGEWTISVAGGQMPRWRGDGKELYFEAADGKMMATPVKKAVPGAMPEFEPGVPLPLFDAHLARYDARMDRSDDRYFEYDVTADGKRFLVNTSTSDGVVSAPPLTLETNWLAAARK